MFDTNYLAENYNNKEYSAKNAIKEYNGRKKNIIILNKHKIQGAKGCAFNTIHFIMEVSSCKDFNDLQQQYSFGKMQVIVRTAKLDRLCKGLSFSQQQVGILEAEQVPELNQIPIYIRNNRFILSADVIDNLFVNKNSLINSIEKEVVRNCVLNIRNLINKSPKPNDFINQKQKLKRQIFEANLDDRQQKGENIDKDAERKLFEFRMELERQYYSNSNGIVSPDLEKNIFDLDLKLKKYYEQQNGTNNIDQHLEECMFNKRQQFKQKCQNSKLLQELKNGNLTQLDLNEQEAELRIETINKRNNYMNRTRNGVLFNIKNTENKPNIKTKLNEQTTKKNKNLINIRKGPTRLITKPVLQGKAKSGVKPLSTNKKKTTNKQKVELQNLLGAVSSIETENMKNKTTENINLS